MPEQDSDEPTLMLPLARADDDPHTAQIPVVADATGRRRRAAQRIAVGAFVAAGGYSLMVLWSFLGGPVSPDTLMPFSTPNAAPAVQSAHSSAQPTTAGAISVPPAPSTAKSSAVTVPTGSSNPSTSTAKSPSASATASPSPSASATARRTTGSGKPGKTSGPGHGG